MQSPVSYHKSNTVISKTYEIKNIIYFIFKKTEKINIVEKYLIISSFTTDVKYVLIVVLELNNVCENSKRFIKY